MVTEKKATTTRGRVERASAPAARLAKRAPSAGKRSAKTPQRDDAGTVSATERALMIARAAYHRAERRGFVPGHEVEDWLAAEREINRLLGPPAPSGSESQG